MSLIIAAAVLALIETGEKPAPLTATPIVAAAPAAAESAGAAREWLALVDAQDWNPSWSAAGQLFKSRITAAEWASKVQPLRQQLGPASSRVLQSVTKASSLPGSPDGQYEILQVATSFRQKPAAVETVTLAREPAGWKVNGYFVR